MIRHGKIMAVLILLLIAVIAIPFVTCAFASSDAEITLTYETACNLALEQAHSIVEIDQAIEKLSDQYYDAIELRMKMIEILRSMDEYKKLYDMEKNGTQLSMLEQWQLGIYMGMFGPKPLELSQTDVYKNYIVHRDLTHEVVLASLQNTRLNKEKAMSAIRLGIRQIYDSILDLQDALLLQEQLYDSMVKQNEQMLKKYRIGQVAEIERYVSEVSLQQQKLNIDIMKRNLDNLQMSLKQQLGIPLKKQIVLAPYESKPSGQEITYEEYLERALVNRYEIISAKRELDLKKKEHDIMKQYILNELLTERLEIQLAVDESQITYDEAVETVTKDVFEGYKDITELKDNVEIARQKQINAENQYDNINMMYQKGLISLSNLWDADISRAQARAAYIKAVRDYARAVDKLDAACGFGPSYVSNMGGLQ